MLKLRSLVAIVGVLALLLSTHIPASAHADAVYHGDDYAVVSTDHLRGKVCDNEKDGHWVYAVFYLQDGSQVGAYGRKSDSPCTKLVFDSPAIQFSIREEGEPRTFTEWT
jgi:hypothetical protein